MVDYHDMSREELIMYIDNLKKMRAFTEEDRFLLKILDASPFTIWASDRDCIIQFWEGQCESLYGYKKSDAIGKDFVDLFVAVDEQKAAREDQLKIIDTGEVFHNIANDYAKTGNTLRLLTNCWRMKSPDSDEYWNVEMGLIVDFFYQEMERLEEIISESRLYKARVTQFLDLVKQIRRQFSERRKNFTEAIIECRRQALMAKKAAEFKSNATHYKNVLKNLDDRLNNLIDNYLQQVQGCGSSVQCEELTDVFKEKYYELLEEFEEEVINFEEVAFSYTPDGIVLGKDTVLKECAIEFEKHYKVAFELKLDINRKIDTYKAQVTKRAGSTIFQYYRELLEQIDAIVASIHSLQDKIYKDVETVQNYNEVMDIRTTMKMQFADIEAKIKEVDSAFKREGR